MVVNFLNVIYFLNVSSYVLQRDLTHEFYFMQYRYANFAFSLTLLLPGGFRVNISSQAAWFNKISNELFLLRNVVE